MGCVTKHQQTHAGDGVPNDGEYPDLGWITLVSPDLSHFAQPLVLRVDLNNPGRADMSALENHSRATVRDNAESLRIFASGRQGSGSKEESWHCCTHSRQLPGSRALEIQSN